MRERGFDASLVAGDADAIRREVGEGRPVILLLRLLDLPGERKDVHHYVVVDGHDPRRDLFRLQFGDGRARWAAVAKTGGAVAPGPDRVLALDTLGRVQLARGRCGDAARTFAEALAGPALLDAATRAELLEGLDQARRSCNRP